MLDPSSDPKLLRTPDQPAYRPFPEVARALRAQVQSILNEWHGRTLFSMPELSELTVKEFQNDIARILGAIADALESNDPPDLRQLVRVAPSHGFQRFMQAYDLAELFAEQRVLRRVMVARVEERLQRTFRTDESAAFHSMIDIMLQQGVLALVYEQKQMIGLASEAQLKYLSFLSHDLANNFLLISSNLEVLRRNLDKRSDMQDSTEVISAALASMHRTREGMRRLLEHEHLRHSKTRPRVIAVNLMQVAEPVIVLAASDALGKGMRVEMDINPHANVLTNPDLLTVILQNLVGNAIKHSARSAESRNSPGGCVRVTTRREAEIWILSVTDDGPGISPEHLDRLFKAFEQLPQPEPGTDPDRGFGLGLAIASQAARLLDTVIEVETRSGVGSTFSVRFPSAPRDTGTKD